MNQRPRAVFFGTPRFAVASLDALTEITDVVGVVAQPDKPAGRGQVLTPPAVKVRALELGIPVIQPAKVRDGTLEQWLRERQVDVALVVAYGRILPKPVLDAPKYGCINVHASLLPKFRGAAPIQWAILTMEKETGVTLMKMDEGMDTGPILSMRSVSIGEDESAEQLAMRLSALGAQIVRQDLPLYLQGRLTPIAQDESRASTAPMLSKAMSELDFKSSARQLHAKVRALKPWPATSTHLGMRRLIVHETTLKNAPPLIAGAPGEIVRVDKDVLWVATGDGVLGLTELQLEGKKRLRVREFIAGHPIRVGTILAPPEPMPSIPSDPSEHTYSTESDRE